MHGVNLWQPLLDATKTPTYALAPFARRMMYLGLKQILAAGKKPRILGLEWNQWEAEAAPLNSAGMCDADETTGFGHAVSSNTWR